MVMMEKTTKVPMKILYFFMISGIIFFVKVQKQDIICNISKAINTYIFVKKRFLSLERINLYQLKINNYFMKFITLSKTLLIAAVFTGAIQINAQQKTPGINLSLMDKTISPKNDFFKIVNGTW